MRRVLVIEDEKDIANVVRAYLAREGYDPIIAHDGERGWAEFIAKKPDAVILDLMLPGVDGVELCRRIREAGDVPVIMLTAKVEEIDRILGLEIGADDYVTKPFSPRELMARLKAVFRRTHRSEAQTAQETLRVGELELEVTAHAVRAGQSEMMLTPAEFAILETLMRQPGRAFSRQQLLDTFDQGLEGYERNTDTHIKNLRKKMSEVGLPQYITTVYGVGYKIDVPRT
jgi:two-component system, OmpR family, response regulator AdeR